MSTEIVTEICPPPEWKLAAEDIHKMVDALEETYEIYSPAFERCHQAAHGWVYLKGLLSDLPRKVTERIALRFGKNVRSLQHFNGQSPWSSEPTLKIHQGLVVETLGEADGVLLIDESGMVKQGQHSVGVFACRSEYRPNPIAVTTMMVLDVDVEQGIVQLPWIDAIDGTPLLDLKPYIPISDRIRDFYVAPWLADWPDWMEDAGAYFAEHPTDFGD